MTRKESTGVSLLFEECSRMIWNGIVTHHEADDHLAEHVFAHIIINSRDKRNAVPNMGIWTSSRYLPEELGGDLDIFVETGPGRFMWWALQAKVLRISGKYEGLTSSTDGEYPWTRLNRLSAEAGCVVRYLFYNGVADFSCDETDRCKNPFTEDQFGCSLVKTKDVEKIGRTRPPRFEDFHPDLAQPWRIIASCPLSVKSDKVKFYSAAQVEESLKCYTMESGDAAFELEDFRFAPVNNFPVGAIEEFSSTAQRDVAFRMVIRATKVE